jgi:hypothetical protein
MKTLLCFLLFFTLIAVSVCANEISQNISDIDNEADLLASELTLAKKTNIYFIFDLKKKEVILKSRGIVLKEMKIEEMKYWGGAVDAKPQVMLQKSALFKEPKRVTIDPTKAKEEETSTNTTPKAPGAFEIEALELKDMPTTYHLEFSKGVFISVRPKAAGFVSVLYSFANYAGWYLSRPILTIWHSIKGRTYISIYLTMSEEDARSIYWSLVENSENIISMP